MSECDLFFFHAPLPSAKKPKFQILSSLSRSISKNENNYYELQLQKKTLDDIKDQFVDSAKSKLANYFKATMSKKLSESSYDFLKFFVVQMGSVELSYKQVSTVIEDCIVKEKTILLEIDGSNVSDLDDFYAKIILALSGLKDANKMLFFTDLINAYQEILKDSIFNKFVIIYLTNFLRMNTIVMNEFLRISSENLTKFPVIFVVPLSSIYSGPEQLETYFTYDVRSKLSLSICSMSDSTSNVFEEFFFKLYENENFDLNFNFESTNRLHIDFEHNGGHLSNLVDSFNFLCTENFIQCSINNNVSVSPSKKPRYSGSCRNFRLSIAILCELMQEQEWRFFSAAKLYDTIVNDSEGKRHFFELMSHYTKEDLLSFLERAIKLCRNSYKWEQFLKKQFGLVENFESSVVNEEESSQKSITVCNRLTALKNHLKEKMEKRKSNLGSFDALKKNIAASFCEKMKEYSVLDRFNASLTEDRFFVVNSRRLIANAFQSSPNSNAAVVFCALETNFRDIYAKKLFEICRSKLALVNRTNDIMELKVKFLCVLAQLEYLGLIKMIRKRALIQRLMFYI